MLDEKHVLKRAAAGLVPAEILRRPKQPYRAPDALSFVGATRPTGSRKWSSRARRREAGVFDPEAVAAAAGASAGPAQVAVQFSNADNMALVGVLSTGLLLEQLVRRPPDRSASIEFQTTVDRLSLGTAGDTVVHHAREMLPT